ncbi:MAG: response regulator [Thermomicrobiales bacterium]
MENDNPGQVRGLVLVVDDDIGVRMVMAAALEDDGWSVETAENGRQALDILRRVRPDVIVLDLRMPVMDGLDFAERYRESEPAAAPIILVSATVTEAAARRSGATAFLRKPTDLTLLLDAVARVAGG